MQPPMVSDWDFPLHYKAIVGGFRITPLASEVASVGTNYFLCFRPVKSTE